MMMLGFAGLAFMTYRRRGNRASIIVNYDRKSKTKTKTGRLFKQFLLLFGSRLCVAPQTPVKGFWIGKCSSDYGVKMLVMVLEITR
jgi:hypothetical protein